MVENQGVIEYQTFDDKESQNDLFSYNFLLFNKTCCEIEIITEIVTFDQSPQ